MRGAGRSKALVANWFDVQPEPVQRLATALQQAIAQAAPQLDTTVKWGNLVFMLDGVALMSLSPHKAHLALQFFNGSQLPAHLGPLEGAGRGSRQLRCRLNQDIDPVAVEMLVSASVALAERQAAGRPPRVAPGPDDTP